MPARVFPGKKTQPPVIGAAYTMTNKRDGRDFLRTLFRVDFPRLEAEASYVDGEEALSNLFVPITARVLQLHRRLMKIKEVLVIWKDRWKPKHLFLQKKKHEAYVQRSC